MSAAEREFYRNRPLFGLDGRFALIHAESCPRAVALGSSFFVRKVVRRSAVRDVVASGIALVGGLFGVAV